MQTARAQTHVLIHDQDDMPIRGRRLLPILRRVAEERLRLRHNVDLNRSPDAARAVLGEAVWDLTTRRAEPGDRTTPSPSLAEVAAALDGIEAL